MFVYGDKIDFVSHFVSVDAVKDAVDFGFEKFLVEFGVRVSFVGDDLLVDVFFFEIVFFGGVGGEVAAGVAENAR